MILFTKCDYENMKKMLVIVESRFHKYFHAETKCHQMTWKIHIFQNIHAIVTSSFDGSYFSSFLLDNINDCYKKFPDSIFWVKVCESEIGEDEKQGRIPNIKFVTEGLLFTLPSHKVSWHSIQMGKWRLFSLFSMKLKENTSFLPRFYLS